MTTRHNLPTANVNRSTAFANQRQNTNTTAGELYQGRSATASPPQPARKKWTNSTASLSNAAHPLPMTSSTRCRPVPLTMMARKDMTNTKTRSPSIRNSTKVRFLRLRRTSSTSNHTRAHCHTHHPCWITVVYRTTSTSTSRLITISTWAITVSPKSLERRCA
jgi:hypothetical protein